ncbi:PAS domain S-box protein [Paracidovorax anthurii]|uniref:Sensory/regulatory protein RpfC n=1 Tax=Paracidovorax anthurii TaxID=78229 RepID=A0A328YSQ0_9BURK|nr:PAS domain S-box protein [Paracidovorax anthurii]RAR76740.1 hypothetical protein AX018_104316 [Paracidovorax anthurii]
MVNGHWKVRSAVAGVLLGGMALVILAVSWQIAINRQAREAAFEALVARVVERVQTGMERYEYGLRGARGAIIAAGPDNINREMFRQYAQSRDIAREFPGAWGFGFVRRVALGEEAAFLARARRDGAPDFTIRQLEPHAGERYVIQYAEPRERNAVALGLDVASETRRRTAAERAMRENTPILTAPLALLQQTGKSRQSFLLLLPIYRPGAVPDTPESREEATIGWSYAPLVMDEILAAQRAREEGYVLALRDRDDGAPGTEAAPFHATSPWQATVVDGLRVRVPLTVYGRQWEAEILATPQFVAALHQRAAWEVAVLGAGVVALLAALAWLAGQGAGQRDALQAARESRAAMVESSPDAIIGVALDGRVIHWNPAAQAIFGHAEADMVGRPIDTLFAPGNPEHEHAGILARVRRGELVSTFETTRLRRDGTRIDVAVSAAPLRNARGAVVGVVKTLRDISQNKAAERALQQLTADLERKVAERTLGLETARRDLRNILDALPSMVGYWDDALRNRFANKAYRDWLGVGEEPATGRSMLELLGQNLFERNEPYARSALRGVAQTFDRSETRRDGPGIRHWLAHYLPDIVDGTVRGFYVLVHDVTELTESRQAAAAAQRDNDFLLRTIHEHAIVSVADRSGRITDVNPAFCAISGYSREELLGRTHRLINSGTHDAGFWPGIWRTIASGKVWHGEVCNRAKDGSLYWVDSIIAPFADADGQVDRYISIRFDITERKRAAAELAATHERLALATDAASLGVWELDLETRSLRWDDWMYRIYRQTRHHDVEPYALWLDRVHPDDRERATQELSHCIAELKDVDMEFRVLWPDGQVRHIKAMAKLHRSADGRPLRMIGINWDITDRKQVELDLSQTTSLLRMVLASASEVAIIATDADFVVRIFNRGAERLLGYDSTDIIGTNSTTLFHDPQEIDARAQELGQALGHAVPASAEGIFREPSTHGHVREWTYLRKDGSRVVVSLVVTPMYGDDGRLLGFLGVAYDMSDQKEHEQALEWAKTAAEQASLAKSQFLANMSHEIRTPMNAVIGLTYLLEQTSLDAQQAEFLQKILRASKALLGVINNILDLSKIEAGELSVSPEPFILRDSLHYLMEVVRVQADAKRIGLTLDLPDGLPRHLVGDALRLNQILTNLLSNAIKFTERGGVRLIVRSLPDGDASIRLRFEVHDSGIGISPEDAARLFQPFAQADATITRRFGGTGLGLSIVRQLAELMGGRVGLESVPGTGSQFWVELPFGRAEAAIEVAEAKKPQEPEMTGLSGVRVLVVDDSDINLEVARRVLELQGASVGLAANGQEAIDRLQPRGEAFDIVLMDIHMPVMDGLTATRFIRSSMGLTDLPVIALTAGALASQRQEAENVGMNDFIVKPFSPRDVVACIRRYLPADRAAGNAQALPAITEAPHSSDWPDIPGIAVEHVARQLGGDLVLFRSLLGHLLREFQEFPIPADSEADWRDTTARVHKLRGASGTVGAQDVHRLATDAENACRAQNRMHARALIAALNESLAHLREHAAQWLSSSPQAPDPLSSPASVPALSRNAPEVVRLRELLLRQDLAALDLFATLAPGLGMGIGASSLESIREHIDELRFVQAVEALDQAWR